jgi:membrane protein
VSRAGGTTMFDRLEGLAVRRPARVGRYNVSLVAARGSRRIGDVRVTGLAAEMTYYALISLIPLVTALGAALGFLQRFVGEQRVTEIEDGLVEALGRVFDQELTDDVLAPIVQGLLREERAGVALGGVVVALWLAARMFRAAIRALDDAYAVPERRSVLSQFALGLGLSVLAVLTLVMLLSMVVIGPLLGGGRAVADALGLGDVFAVVWAVARWPAVAAAAIGFLALVYRHGPNVETTYRHCLPGAVFGAVGLVVVAVGFQVYLSLAGPAAPQVEGDGEAVVAAAQTIGAVMAGVLWLWLSSIVILVGGVVNAELQRQREESV